MAVLQMQRISICALKHDHKKSMSQIALATYSGKITS